MSSYSTFRHLSVDVNNGIAVVRFAPTKDESIERSFFHEVRDVFTPLATDREVKGVVLTGTEGRFVSPLPKASTRMLFTATLEETAVRLLTIQQLSAQVLSFRKPLVAAVNGGGRSSSLGPHLAFLSDVVVASEDAVFLDHHVAAGIAAGDGATMYWPVLVGVARARQILLRGRPMSAAEARDLGLVAELVPEDRVVEAGIEVARELSMLPSLAFMATKLALNNVFKHASLISWDLASAYEAAGIHTHEPKPE